MSCIEVDPSNSNRITAGTIAHSFTLNPDGWGGADGVGVITSVDGGITWTVSDYYDGGVQQAPGAMGYISEVKRSPSNSNVVIATGNTKVYKSTDGGMTFSRVFTLPTKSNANGKQGNGVYIADVAFNLSNPSTIVATCKSNEQTFLFDSIPLDYVYVSNQGGSLGSWGVLPLPHSQSPHYAISNRVWHPSVVWVDATPADSGNLYFIFSLPRVNKEFPNGTKVFYNSYEFYGYSYGSSGFVQLFRDSLPTPSYDVNPNAYNRTGDLLTTIRKGFEVSHISTSRWYVSGNTLGIRDQNTWEIRTRYYPRTASNAANSTHADIRDIQITGVNGSNDVVFIANDGGVAKSTNGGISWQNINGNGLTISQFFGFDLEEGTKNFVGAAIHNDCYDIDENGTWEAFTSIPNYFAGGDGEYAEIVETKDGRVDYLMTSGGDVGVISYHSEALGFNATIPHYDKSKCVVTGPLGRRFIIHPTFRGVDSTGYETRMIYGCGLELRKQEIGKNLLGPVEKVFNRGVYIPDPKVGPVSIARFAPSNPLTCYLAMEDYPAGDTSKRHMLWKTTNDGQSWTNINPQFVLGNDLINDYSWVMDILVHPKDENVLFVSMANYYKDASGYGKKRVLYSIDGGQSWSDYSINLPAVPANTLALSGDNMLYVGTDAGVYYMDISNVLNNDPQASSDAWTCFNLDLPNAMIEQLRVDECSGKIYAAVRGMGIWETDLLQSTIANDTISGVVTWSDSRSFQGDIIVPRYAHLTITGSLNMGKSSQIIVLPGGILTVDGGYIGSTCKDFWGGIYVAGSSEEAQDINYQGWLEIINGGTIASARDAITNININPETGEWIPGTTGGIIRLNTAHFINNRRDIQLLRYNYANDNKLHYDAKIYHCQFIKNDNFSIETMLPAISMWDVHGVIVKGSTFSNQNTGIFAHDGGGIYAINALFKVDEDLQGGCSFDGFAEAIRSENYALPLLGNGEIEVRNSTFTNNIHSIYIGGANMSSVIDNQIQVPNTAVPALPSHILQTARYGIYMDMCPTFDVRQNSLKTDGINGSITSVGIVVNSAGGNNNNLYKNEVDGFTIGLESIGDNRSTNSNAANDGLFYRCNTLGATGLWNTNHGNTEDIYVGTLTGASRPSSGVALNHGYVTLDPATLPNNLFQNSSLYYQFENRTANTHNYYFEESAPSAEPTSVLFVAKHRISVANYNWNSFCIDLPEAEDVSINATLSALSALQSELTGDLSLRTQYLNGGNTAALEAAILFANDQQDYQNLYIELMDMAPYVEESQLMDLIGIGDFPELALRNVFVANPHGARNPEIWEMLLNRDPLLSQQTLNDIEQEQETITAFDVLQMAIGNTRAQLEYHKNTLVRKYLDDFENNESALLNFLSNEDDPTYLYVLAEGYLAQGNTTAALSVLNNLPSTCTLSEDELDEYTSLYNLYSLLSNNGSEMPVNNLTTTQLNTLLDILNGGYGVARAKANALLKLNGEATGYVEPILTPQTGSSKTSTTGTHTDRPATVAFQVRLYPNPATHSARLEWNPAEFVDVQEMSVQLTSMDGRVLFTGQIDHVDQSFYALDLSHVSAGTYLVTLRSNEHEIYTTTLVVE